MDKEEDSKLVDNYLEYIEKVQGYSKKTSISYRHDLERLLDFLYSHNMNIEDMTAEDAKEFTSGLYEQKLSVATINRILSGNKSFFHHLCANGVVKVQPFSGIRHAKQGQRIPTVLSKEELESLLSYRYKDYTQLCEITMFNIFYSTGCRLSEVMSMKVSDIDFSKHRVLVTGKGSKQRFVFLTKRCLGILDEYLPQRKAILNETQTEDDGILLINKKGKHLPFSTVHTIFDKYRDELGITKKFTPHVFRHTFATDLLDNSSDIRIVQELLGHENIGTTQIYTHVTGSKLERVYRDAHPHGRKDEF